MKKSLSLFTVTVLAGCTAFSDFSEIQALNEASAVGSPFTQALTEEYKMFSNTEMNDMFDYPDALHFARKGLGAASGATVLPEPVADWNLDEQDQQILGDARARLMRLFGFGAREVAPELSARAQGKFDCWIEREEENARNEPILCKEQFMEALNALEAQINRPAEPVIPEAPVTPAVQPELDFGVDSSAPMQAENAMYLVFFNWDKSNVTASAESILDAVSREIQNNPPSVVSVTGFTDTSGSATYNQRLALKRANRVRDALIARGVDASLISVDAQGENQLLVPTGDNVREAANRRASISFQ